MQFRSGIAVAVAWLAATAPIRRLAWEPPYASGVALKSQKKKKRCFQYSRYSMLISI